MIERHRSGKLTSCRRIPRDVRTTLAGAPQAYSKADGHVLSQRPQDQSVDELIAVHAAAHVFDYIEG